MLHRFYFLKFFVFLSLISSLSAYKPEPLTLLPEPAEHRERRKENRSDWTFIVYIAADNDLDYFARRNIEEMKLVGSNKNISIVVQLDRHGIHERTKRLYVTQEAIYQMNATDETAGQKLNSGSAQTLIDCCKWAIEEFPAQHYALVLWNHGIGILDSIRSKTTNASELFTFNPANHMLELDRSIGFLQFLEEKANQPNDRGVCFSDTYGSYLTNQKIDYALKEITQNFLGGKKLDIVAFDACLMAMVEVGSLIKPYVDYMVASQEVELGTGWPYHHVLAPFLEKPLSPKEFASHIVRGYKKGYENITSDFTQSAIDLKYIDAIENSIKKISSLLIQMLHHQLDYSVKRAIRASRSRRVCTCFAEPSYIDLHHFFTNLLETIDFMHLEKEKMPLIPTLKKELWACLKAIDQAVITNETGSNLESAKGLSIYFPLRHIDPSYLQIPFIKTTRWDNFLRTAL